MDKKLIKYFLQGILFTLPLVISFYVIYLIIVYIDNLIPIDIPGIGLLTILVSITLIGFLGSKLINSQIKRVDAFMTKAPLLKIIYTSVKDFLSAFVGEKKSFNSPVLVKLSTGGAEMLGFITNDDLTHLKISEKKIAVYIPYSYAFTGNLMIVEKSKVTPLDASSTDVLKFVLSGGVTKLNLKEKKSSKKSTKKTKKKSAKKTKSKEI